MIRSLSCLVLILLALLGGPAATYAQVGEGSVRVIASSDDGPVSGALVRAGAVTRLTNEVGQAVLPLPAGPQTLTVERLGFAVVAIEVLVAAGAEQTVEVELDEEAEEIDEIIVTSTRGERRIEDEPLRIEVLAREEIEEKLLMTPGDIAMMLNETSGLRVQNTSPSLGGANVRIQGLRGRYTQILSDGLPLYGGQTGSLSMLQIPPMDLGQVEVIKGVASALYGSSALGGVINLISRRPEDEREILLNASTLGGADGVLWLADEVSDAWGYSLLGGLHRQGQADVDDDGWADVPAYRRAVLRPRIVWQNGAGTSLLVTIGGTLENREGGTLEGNTTPAATSFQEQLETRRGDVGLIGRFLVGEERLLTVRGSAMGQRHEHFFGEDRERDLHANAFGEVAYGGTSGRHSWVIGSALNWESYRSDDVEGFDFDFVVPSAFLQDEYSLSPVITLAGSGRLDHHSEYGTFLNPRISVLLRPNDWTVRASVGTGYFAPTPFTEETEAVGLARLEPLGELEPETATSASLDIGREFSGIEVNGTLFGSQVEDALQAQSVAGGLRIINASGPVRTWGGELLTRVELEPFHVNLTYAHVRSSESDPDGSGRREVPLTPRHTAGIVGMWEEEGVGRVGLELYYTGRQQLDDNPYRSESSPYVVTGVLVERRFGSARLFINAENLLDARQTAHDPLVLPARSPEGRWTTDAWAPLEGRAINGGVRYEF